MIALPLLYGFLIANPSYPQSQELLPALYREFDPSLVPQLYQIALCESGLRQWTDSGEVVKSETNDFGAMQINGVHEPEAEALGLDFKGSMEDNVKMAKIVYAKQGLGAWTCARRLGII